MKLRMLISSLISMIISRSYEHIFGYIIYILRHSHIHTYKYAYHLYMVM